MTEIHKAGPDEVTEVADLVATAFFDNEISPYLVPDPAVRQQAMAGQFRIIVEHATAHGSVEMVAGGRAAAVWFPRTGPLPEPADYDARLAAATGEAVERFRVLDAHFEAHHPEEPHHHLALLAVHPAEQGQGLGSMLLDHHHALISGTAAYLETANPKARALYARHGYRDRGGFTMPDGTVFWTMWRPEQD
jgi:GNAT superfamily N-acetyltransferase